MSCKFCRTAPLRDVHALDRDVSEGELSVTEVAGKHGLSLKVVRRHLKRCLGGVPITSYALLQNNLRSLEKLYGEVKEEYDNIDPYEEGSGAAKGFAMKRMLDIRREQRESIMALERIKPSDQLMDEILISTISPLVINATDICTQELRRLRKEVAVHLEDNTYGHLDTAVKDALHRIGERLSQEVTQLQPSLKKILNSEHAKKDQTPARPSSKRGPSTSTRH